MLTASSGTSPPAGFGDLVSGTALACPPASGCSSPTCCPALRGRRGIVVVDPLR